MNIMLEGKWCIALELEESEFCAAAQRELGYRIVAESVLAVACIPGEDLFDLPGTSSAQPKGHPCFCNWGTKWRGGASRMSALDCHFVHALLDAIDGVRGAFIASRAACEVYVLLRRLGGELGRGEVKAA